MNPEQLEQIPVLRDIDGEALARLAAALEEKSYTEGQIIFMEGDRGDSMYFIAQGQVRIEKRARGGTAVKKILTVLEAGDFFGEMALFDEKPRSASAVACGETKILRLAKASFDQVQRTSSAVVTKVLFAMIRTFSSRIRRLSTQLVAYDEVGKAIGEAVDLQGLLDRILQQLSSAVEADWGLLLLRSQFSERFELRSLENLTITPAQRESMLDGEGFLRSIRQKPEHLLLNAFGTEEPFRSCSRLGFETPSMLVSPIMLEDQLLGIILLGGAEQNQFDPDDLNLCRGIARQTAQAICNARHREEEQARSRHSRQYVKF